MDIAGSAINNVVKSVSTHFDHDYRALVIGAGAADGAIGSASDALTQDGATARIWIGKPFCYEKNSFRPNEIEGWMPITLLCKDC